MRDIVEHLRSADAIYGSLEKLHEQAADEIERLRNENVALAAAVDDATNIAYRLKSELNVMRSAFHNNMLRAFPKMTHEEIASAINAAMQEGTKK